MNADLKFICSAMKYYGSMRGNRHRLLKGFMTDSSIFPCEITESLTLLMSEDRMMGNKMQFAQTDVITFLHLIVSNHSCDWPQWWCGGVVVLGRHRSISNMRNSFCMDMKLEAENYNLQTSLTVTPHSDEQPPVVTVTSTWQESWPWNISPLKHAHLQAGREFRYEADLPQTWWTEVRLKEQNGINVIISSY